MKHRDRMQQALDAMPYGRDITTEEIRLRMGITHGGLVNRAMHNLLRKGLVDKTVAGSETTPTRWIRT